MGRWINTKERMPFAEYGESDDVLTINELGNQKVLYFDGSCWCHPSGEPVGRKFPVTHWQPLPEPPGEEGE